MSLSTRLIRKGALTEDARAILAGWDLTESIRHNINRLSEAHILHAGSESWSREIFVTMSSRLGRMSARELQSVVQLARSTLLFEGWTACWHWHCATSDLMYRQFMLDWLYPRYESGYHRVRSQDVLPFVRRELQRIRGAAKPLSDYGAIRAARDLMRMASDFGLLVGGAVKEFASYHIPEESFLYLLHAMADTGLSAKRLVEAPDWKMFLMDVSDVERELLRLHQFRKVHYEVAGSIVELQLPFASAAEYAKEISG